MQTNEIAINREKSTGANWKKTVLLNILKKLKYGNLMVYERGELIGTFGQEADSLCAKIDILDNSFYSKLLFGGSIGVGESYMDGDWETLNLTNVIQIFARNLEVLDDVEQKMSWLTMPLNRLLHFKNRNSINQAKNNISSHYDLGNVLYKSFLDPSMLYSSAIFLSSGDSLAQAQQNKMKIICEKLELKKTDRVVEVGTGWGALAIYMAKNYGCHVTTSTISEEQYNYTKDLVKKHGLEDNIVLLKEDYRLIEGRFDKLVSVEMIEAVGKQYLDSYFKKCEDLLKPGGMMLIQSITIADQRMTSYQNSVDFIQKHIFPGGFLPSLQMILNKVTANTELALRDVHDIGLDYAKTLKHWRENFEHNFQTIRDKGYDERFFRMWKFYLEYCEAGFLERSVSTVQVLMTAKGHRHEIQCRK